MTAAQDRVAMIMNGISKDNTRGIEIGPWASPMAPKKAGWGTIVIDYADAEALRSNALKHPATVNAAMIETIEEVDIVWPGGSLKELLASHGVKNLDYFVSSHNIEHAVDIIDHLQAAEASLHETGILSLAIPDMRYTFDFLRNPTTVADALRVHRQRHSFHEPEHFLDQQLNALLNHGQPCWTTSTALQQPSLAADPVGAWNQYRSILNGDQYQDCHRWCFVPASFELLIHDLCWMGLLDLTITSLQTAESGLEGSEFLVQLRKNATLPPVAESHPPADLGAQRLALQFKILQQLADRLRVPPYRLPSGSQPA